MNDHHLPLYEQLMVLLRSDEGKPGRGDDNGLPVGRGAAGRSGGTRPYRPRRAGRGGPPALPG